jgi:ParB-like nuclease domain
MSQKSSNLPFNEPTKIRFDLLAFDKENPRLMTGDDWSASDDRALLTTYGEIAALDELVLSIATNGYLPLEPLIVCGPDDGPYTVLEGNRRLAAMKALSNPALAKECRISVPNPVPAKSLKSFEEVLVIRVRTAKDAEAFIGFKHINGPQRWDSYAKARFVAAWYLRERDKGLTIDQIARQTGDTNDTTRSYIGAIFVLDQAEKDGLFEIKDRYNKGRFAFSHLYTALDRPEYRNFLGLDLGWNEKPSDNPIRKDKKPEAAEVLKFIYGSKRDKIEPLVKKQNPNLAELGKCLASDTALLRLRSGSDLAVAYAEVDGGRTFNQALGELMAKAEKAMSLAPKFDGNKSQLTFISEIKLKVLTVENMMLAVVSQKNK